jgi:hypothetical protein
MLSKTDTKDLLATLERAAMIINSLSTNTWDANVARKCRLLRKKIIRNDVRRENKGQENQRERT